VLKVPVPGCLAEVSSAMIGPPSASLSVGPGAGPPPPPPLQICLVICCVLAWLALAPAIAGSGTPHAVLLSTRNLTSRASFTPKVLDNPEASWGGGLRWVAARSAAAPSSAAWRIGGNCMQTLLAGGAPGGPGGGPL